MYGAAPSGGGEIPPSGGQEELSGRTADPADPALAVAVRIQRRRHAWALAMIWLIAAFLLLAGSVAEASQNDTPAPAWFVDLMLLAAAAATATLVVVIGYSVAMGRRPAELRKQAILLERQRLRQQWQGGWARRVVRILYSLAEWLGFALFLGSAVIGVPWAINGAAYLAGAGQVVRWAAAVPIHSDGDATASLIVGLLFVFAGVLVVLFIYRRATRVWWPRYLRRKAG